MIRPIDIRLNAAHPDYPLAEAVTFTGAPSTVLIRGVPPNCGRWAITAVSVAATYPDGSTTTRAAVQSANGVWVATLPATATSGRTANGLRILADGIDENGAAVTGYILGVADFAVASLGVTPAPQPGETSWQMLYFDATPATPRKGDVIRADGDLKFYNGTAWLPFTDLSNYYTAEQVDEAIDKLAAYYITYTAAGANFPTRADLLNAQTYYSGGVARVPTRNDYAVVLADETHSGAEYRYIYAVADGETVGQWEAQYPIETNDYAALANKPQINGNTLTGNKTGASLGLVNTSNGLANQLRLLIAATTGSSAGVYALRVKYDEATFHNRARLEIVKQPAGPSASEVIVATIDLPASDGTLAFLQNIAPNFSTSATYALDALCVYGGVLYRCTTAVTTAGAWTGSTNWTAATVDDALAVIRAAKLDADSGTMTGTFNLNGRLNVNYSDGTAYEIDYYGIRVHYQGGVTKQISMPHIVSYAGGGTGYMALVNNLAPDFSTSTTYYAGDLVRKNGALFICTATSHTGAWSDSDFAVATIQDALASKLGHDGPWVNGYIDVLECNVGESVPYGVRIYRDKIVFGAFTNTVPRSFTPIRQFDLPATGGTLALTANVPYDLVAKTVDNGAVTLDDRASNAVTISATLSPNTLTVNFPMNTSGKARDFAMRLNIAAGVTAPEIVWPQGVTLENNGGEMPEIADGGTDGSSTILYFSETENDGTTAKFLVKGETLTAIAQA